MITRITAVAHGLESSNSEAVAGLLQESLGCRERDPVSSKTKQTNKTEWESWKVLVGVITIHCSTDYTN